MAQAPAQRATTQAITLAPSLWEANYSQAFYNFYFERAWQKAGPHFEKAIAINPRASLAQAYYGLFLTAAGRSADALARATLACELDPLAPVILCLAAAILFTLGRYAEAERAAQQSLEFQPDYLFAHWQRALALCGLGRDEEAIAPLERAATLSRAPIFVGLLGFGYGRVGRGEDASRLLRELEDRGSRGEYIPPTAALAIFVGQRDIPGIRSALAKVVADGGPPLTVRVLFGEFLETIRTDPEIDRLHRELFGW